MARNPRRWPRLLWRVALVVALLALVAILSAALGHALAQSRVTEPPPPQLVTGLPDFSRLVEQVGPAVVSIEATGVGRSLRGLRPQAGLSTPR